MKINEKHIIKVASKLIELQVKQHIWFDKVNNDLINVNEPVAGGYLFLNCALDLLGYPPENLKKMVCRDWLLDLYDMMVVRHKDTIGYINVVIKKTKLPHEMWDADEIERFLYPNNNH